MESPAADGKGSPQAADMDEIPEEPEAVAALRLQIIQLSSANTQLRSDLNVRC